jgi:uncharacterized protein (TIGR02246 family)
MRSTHNILAVLLSLMALSSVQICKAQDQTQKDDAESAALRQVVDGFMSNFNAHDAHAISEWFTDDSDYINGGGILTHSRAGIEEHYVSLFSGPLQHSQRTAVVVKSIRFLNPGLAAVDISYDLGAVNPDGSPGPAHKGLYNWILVKQNGRWLIEILHEINIGSGPAPKPAQQP